MNEFKKGEKVYMIDSEHSFIETGYIEYIGQENGKPIYHISDFPFIYYDVFKTIEDAIIHTVENMLVSYYYSYRMYDREIIDLKTERIMKELFKSKWLKK